MSSHEWEWHNDRGDRRLAQSPDSSSPSPAPLRPVFRPATFSLLQYSKINTISTDSPTNPPSSSSTPSSTSSITSLSPSGNPPAPNQGRGSFKTRGGRQVPSSMDFYENEHFSRLLVSIALNTDSVLLMHTAFALVAYYMRSNAFKSFEWFSSSPHSTEHAQRLRRTLIKLSSKYYGMAIHELRVLISTRDFNVATAVVVSSLLNKVSIYEYPDLNHSLTFSKGMVSIFNDVLLNIDSWDHSPNKLAKRSVHDMAWITNYILHASKSKHFPAYHPSVVSEYLEVLENFRSILTDTDPNYGTQYSENRFESITFHFNHLYEYATDLQDILNEYNTTEINNNPSMLYELLRHWLIILPSKVHSLDNICSDPLEMTLMALYKCLSRMLESLFPAVLFHFLQGFCGGVSLWTDSQSNSAFVKRYFTNLKIAFEKQSLKKWSSLSAFDHDWPSGNDDPLGLDSLTAEQDNTVPIPEHHISQIYMINRYCLRVNLFFQKRSNIMSLLFGDQRSKPEISPELIKSNLNEVMIKKFNSTNIHFYNFLHLPHTVKIIKSPNLISNLQEMQNTNIYHYNQNHFKYFLSPNSDKVPNDLIEKGKIDPMLRLHIFNTTRIEIDDDEPKEMASSTGYQAKAPVINYTYVFEASFVKSILAALEASYQDLFDGKHATEDAVVFEQHTIGGLLANDNDPLLLANQNDLAMLYTRKPHDLVSNQEISKVILSFYNSRNDVVVNNNSPKRSVQHGRGSKSNKERGNRRDSETDNFYNDLSPQFFVLG